jgi:hypothetical protein
MTPVSDEQRAMLHREQPTAVCDLDLLITRADGLRIEQRIVRLANREWTNESDTYVEDQQILLASGDYSFSLQCRQSAEVFSRRGAIVRLTRTEPAGQGFAYTVAEWLAYACFLLALSGSVVMGIRSPTIR